MIDFKKGYRHVGSINYDELLLIKILIASGYLLFINDDDINVIDIYCGDTNAS
jgi:hypothetical protein